MMKGPPPAGLRRRRCGGGAPPVPAVEVEDVPAVGAAGREGNLLLPKGLKKGMPGGRGGAEGTAAAPFPDAPCPPDDDDDGGSAPRPPPGPSAAVCVGSRASTLSSSCPITVTTDPTGRYVSVLRMPSLAICLQVQDRGLLSKQVGSSVILVLTQSSFVTRF